MTLELRQVNAGYDGVQVLRDVSLVVPPHSVVALLGPNGAGKTTLLRVASGLMAPTSGRLILEGKDVTGWTSDRLARGGLCHVPEGRGIFPNLSVRDNLLLQLPRGASSDRIDEVARVFPRLAERMAQLAGTMSGGEQQMLALAHVYLADPSVVLLDEVSMGLAPRIVDEIFDCLRQFAERGIALLVVEQYVARALALADYVYVLKRGRVEFAGEPVELGSEAVMAAYLGGQ